MRFLENLHHDKLYIFNFDKLLNNKIDNKALWNYFASTNGSIFY